MKTSTGVKLLTVTAVVTVVGALAFALGVYAQVQPGTVNACVPSGTTGVQRTMVYNTTGTCPTGQQLITWNVQGPAGPVGPQGPAGPPSTPVSATDNTVLVMKSSKKSTSATRVALVFCPPGGSPLYGGAGLIGDPEDKVIVANRPAVFHVPAPQRPRVSADPVRPSGWLAIAKRVGPPAGARVTLGTMLMNYHISEKLEDVAIRFMLENHDSASFDESALKKVRDSISWGNEGAIAGEALAEDPKLIKPFDGFRLPGPKSWGVTAWAVCDVSK